MKTVIVIGLALLLVYFGMKAYEPETKTLVKYEKEYIPEVKTEIKEVVKEVPQQPTSYTVVITTIKEEL
jgi:hypothetical protein